MDALERRVNLQNEVRAHREVMVERLLLQDVVEGLKTSDSPWCRIVMVPYLEGLLEFYEPLA